MRPCASVEHAAHVIVRRRRDRDQIARRIDAGAAAVFVHAGEALRERRADRRARIEERAAPGCKLGEHAARHDIARRKLGIGVDAQHEALARLVDQRRAFAAHRLGRERRRIAADVDRGRMELHELRIGDRRAGARRDGEAWPRASVGLVVTA